MNGWDQTEKLIFQAAKKKYVKDPSIPELMEFVQENVSIAKFPNITYPDILKKAIAERSKELVLSSKKIEPPPPLMSPSLDVPSHKPPMKQWAWITVRNGNEVTDLQNAISTIRQDFTVGREMAKKEDRPFKWLTEREFANDRYRIIDEQKRIIPYETALMKTSLIKSL